jgi:hypothetical protein
MAQVVSRRPLIAEALVRSRVSPCGICGGQSGTGTGFSPSSLVLPLCGIPPWLSTLLYNLGMNKRPVGGHSSETQSRPIAANSRPPGVQYRRF